MHRDRSILLAVLACVACDSKGPKERVANVDLPIDQPTAQISSSTSAQEPPPPVTVSGLVADGQYWRLATAHGPIHIWIPRGYNRRGAETIIYIHGFYTYVDAAWKEHSLASQFAASTINAVFIACEAPANGIEPISWDSLTALLDTVERGIAQSLPRRRIVAVAHSGGWRTLSGWLDEPRLDTVVLLDAVYGDIEQYKNWVLASPKHRLIDVGDDTKTWTEQLHASLPTSVILDRFPTLEEGLPKSAAKAQILYIRSNLGHFPLVTGGVAIPMILQALRGKRVLDVPLADILATQ